MRARRRGGAISVKRLLLAQPDVFDVINSNASKSFINAPKLGMLRIAVAKAGSCLKCFDAVAAVTSPFLSLRI